MLENNVQNTFFVCSKCFKKDAYFNCGKCGKFFHNTCLNIPETNDNQNNILLICDECRAHKKKCADCSLLIYMKEELYKTCNYPNCQNLFHLYCFKQLVKNDLSKINQNYICPAHYCNQCKKEIESKHQIKCICCYVSFHVECVSNANLNYITQNVIICQRHQGINLENISKKTKIEKNVTDISPLIQRPKRRLVLGNVGIAPEKGLTIYHEYQEQKVENHPNKPSNVPSHLAIEEYNRMKVSLQKAVDEYIYEFGNNIKVPQINWNDIKGNEMCQFSQNNIELCLKKASNIMKDLTMQKSSINIVPDISNEEKEEKFSKELRMHCSIAFSLIKNRKKWDKKYKDLLNEFLESKRNE